MLATRHAPNGMVCSVDHLASEAGVCMLRAGGSAADAAVATSAVLAVTTQHMCGMGGDLFALVHDGTTREPAVLNASGRAGSGAEAGRLRAEGHTAMPFRGDIRSVPVPGCVDGWLALHGRYGALPLEDVLAPATAYASQGFPASPLLAATLEPVLAVEGADDYREPGRVRAGTLIRRPGVARAMTAIARDGRAGFYEGEFGAGLLALGRGEYTPEDLACTQADWVDPLGIRVWDHDVWTVPPNSQGYLTLAGAGIAARLDLPDDPGDPLWAHLLIESARQAAFDRLAVLHEGADGRALIAPDRLDRRRARIDPDRRAVLTERYRDGGTIYLCAADGSGMGVSLIQSNASGFGAHLAVPGVGIFLQNRGIGFSLEPGHPAEYAPRRRPPHTLSPALVTRPDGSLHAVVGTMGGDSQPQVLLQLLARVLRHGHPAGRAIGAPRWVLIAPTSSGFDTWAHPEEAQVVVEPEAAPSWADGLRARGHTVHVAPGDTGAFGHAHLITAGRGAYGGAADPRSLIGSAAGY